MISVRRGHERGHAQHGWLDSHHTFSFSGYYDPRHMGFRALRVLNEDRVAPGEGFPRHPHRDMEIISYVIDGALAHEDSMGTGSVIKPGELQRMTAGTGVTHSEMNASEDSPVHFLQIWIVPERAGIAPGYEQKAFAPEEQRGRLRVVASRDGRDGSVTVHQDVLVHAGRFTEGERATYDIAAGRGVFVHVVRGAVNVAGQPLAAGDAITITDAASVDVQGVADGEILLFDLA